MDVFNGNLKTIKELGFRILNFSYKILGKIFIYNSIARSKECKYMGNEMPFPVIQADPVFQVLT